MYYVYVYHWFSILQKSRIGRLGQLHLDNLQFFKVKILLIHILPTLFQNKGTTVFIIGILEFKFRMNGLKYKEMLTFY